MAPAGCIKPTPLAEASGGLEFQERLGGSAKHFGLVYRAERRSVQPVGRHFVRDERPVHREHDAIYTHFRDRCGQGRVREVAARCQVEVLAERLLEKGVAAGARQRLVDAPKQERNAFSEMAEDDLQLRMFLEYSA